MHDTFTPEALPIGCQVVIRAPNDVNVIGIVASVDAEKRTVMFTNGVAYTFGPPEAPVEPEPEPEVTP